MQTLRKHKKLIISAFNPSGLHHILPRVWGGYDDMKVSKKIFNACLVENKWLKNNEVTNKVTMAVEEVIEFDEEKEIILDDAIIEEEEEMSEKEMEKYMNRRRNYNVKEPPRKKRKIESKITNYFSKK